MMPAIYNVIIGALSFVIWPVSWFNKKIYRWLNDRRAQVVPKLDRPIWIHVASLGEFEQGRPLIEAIKKEWPEKKIALTFFSSSGYDMRKDYPVADWIGYIPFDTKKNAQEFIKHLDPSIAIFIKYEFWYNHMQALEKAAVPYIFISNHWRPDHFLLRPSSKWLLSQVLKADHLFVMDHTSEPFLKKLNYYTYTIAGDTRIDRVMEIKAENKLPGKFSTWKNTKPVFIAGSTWPADEKVLEGLIEKNKEYTWILVPHDVSEARINGLLDQFKSFNPIRYSQWSGDTFELLIVDKIGILNKIYSLAKIAYIGGGFGKGIHNTLEAAVYGIPVIFGPNHTKFKEAKDFLNLQIGFCIQNGIELQNLVSELNSVKISTIKMKSDEYFMTNKGATIKIIDYLRKRI